MWVRCATATAASVAILVCASSALASTTNFGPTGTQPLGIALDDGGNVYVSNSSLSSNSVTKILPDGTVVGAPWPVAVGDAPAGIGVDANGYIFVANYGTGFPFTVSRISPDGEASGSAGDKYRWADTQANPYGLALDRAGNVYATNYFSASVTKVAPDGTSDAAWGTTGTNPRDIALDAYGNAYTPNTGTDDVSKITSSGEAGEAPWPVGTGNEPTTVAVDSERNVYVAYVGPPAGVAKFSPSGVAAGSPWPVAVGTTPSDMVIDSAGNVYTANYGANSVTKIEPNGSATTLATLGPAGGGPNGITLDSEGNLYTANTNTDNVTKISPGGGTADIAPAPPAPTDTPSAVAGPGSATVSLDPNPLSARYGAPSSYLISVVQDGAKTCTITPPATSCKITGLTPGGTYRFAAAARLNAWTTASSAVSNAVQPKPHTVAVSGLKAKVSRKSVVLSSKATVSTAGRIQQTAKAGSKTWCTASKTVSAAGTQALSCTLGKKGRAALRRKTLKLSVRTAFTPTAGPAASKTSKLTIKRKR